MADGARMEEHTCPTLLPDGTVCGKPWRSATIELCENHYRRFLKYGDAAHWGIGHGSEYDRIHKSVQYRRGKASDHLCVDCGNPAEQWSLTREPSGNIKYGRGGSKGLFDKDMPYSDNTDDYEPRCKPCHRKYDIPRGEAHHAVVLSTKDCLDIVASTASAKELADFYGTTATTINRIRSGASRSSETGVVYKPTRGPYRKR
jgi:hypothetical protein